MYIVYALVVIHLKDWASLKHAYFLSDNAQNRTDSSRSVQQHKLVYTEERRLRKCVYCHMKNVKTYSGHAVTSYFRCQACDVPLCKTMRNCFIDFHKLIESHGRFNTPEISVSYRGRRRLSGSSNKSDSLTMATTKSDSLSPDNDQSSANQQYTYINLSSPESQTWKLNLYLVSWDLKACMFLKL